MDHAISNLLRIREEINSKNSNNAKIIAVSKTFTEDRILPLIEFGHTDFGENKVQEAVLKWTVIKSNYKEIKLHMIGRLQSNKVKTAVKIFDYIHSVDSYKLAEKISKEQKKIGKNLKLFIQINVGNEDQKNGIELKNVKPFLETCNRDLELDIIGTMCIPPNDDETEKYFSKMQEIKKEINLNELSMGMSNDYLKAIKYGSTFVRIGSKIFGKRD